MVDNNNMHDDELPVDDVIDRAFSDLVHGALGLPVDFDESDLSDEDADQLADDIDEITDVIYEIIDQLIEDGEITDIPDHEDSDDVKQEWVSQCMPKIQQALEQTMQDSEEESDEPEQSDDSEE